MKLFNLLEVHESSTLEVSKVSSHRISFLYILLVQFRFRFAPELMVFFLSMICEM